MFFLLFFFPSFFAQNMRDSLAVGDEITTIGGITGTICAVKENSAFLRNF